MAWSRTGRLLSGFLILWALGIWPHFVPLWIAILGFALFFVVAHHLSHYLQLGGLPGLGLRLERGWGRQIALGFVAGGFVIVLYIVLVSGGYEAVGFRPIGEIQGLLLFTVLNTAYIGFWEETLCRGYLLSALPRRIGVVALAIISGAAFVPFHFTRFGAVPDYFVLYWFLSGIAYALPLLITGSIWISAGMHWGHNLFFAGLLSRDGWLIVQRAENPPVYSEYLILIAAAAMIPVALILSQSVMRRDRASDVGPQAKF